MKDVIKLKIFITCAVHETSETYHVETTGLGRKWYEDNGYLVLEEREIEVERRSREELLQPAVAQLRKKQQSIRATAEKDCVEIDGKINRLLQLEYVEPQENTFAPSRHNNDGAEDVEPF